MAMAILGNFKILHSLYRYFIRSHTLCPVLPGEVQQSKSGELMLLKGPNELISKDKQITTFYEFETDWKSCRIYQD